MSGEIDLSEIDLSEQSVKGKSKTLKGGDSIGFEIIFGRTNDEQLHGATTTATEDCTLATLSRKDFIHVSEEIGEKTVQVLEKKPTLRTQKELTAVNEMFSQTAFMQHLRSRLLQRHCCRYFRVIRVEEGDLLYKQGEEGDAMYIVISGSMSGQFSMERILISY